MSGTDFTAGPICICFEIDINAPLVGWSPRANFFNVESFLNNIMKI